MSCATRRSPTSAPTTRRSTASTTPRSTSRTAPKGLSHEVVEMISRLKKEPEWMRDVPPQGARHLPRQADAHAGATRDARARSTSTTSPTTCAPPRSRRRAGTTCPRTSSRRSTASASRRPSASSSPASSAQYESEVVYHSIKEELDQAGRDLPRHGLRAARAPGDRRGSTSRTVIPAADNKFAALNTAVWSGGSFIYVPQGRRRWRSRCRPTSASTPRSMGQFERTLIIADEGVEGALHRGLHRADLLDRLAALGGGRADRA